MMFLFCSFDISGIWPISVTHWHSLTTKPQLFLFPRQWSNCLREQVCSPQWVFPHSKYRLQSDIFIVFTELCPFLKAPSLSVLFSSLASCSGQKWWSGCVSEQWKAQERNKFGKPVTDHSFLLLLYSLTVGPFHLTSVSVGYSIAHLSTNKDPTSVRIKAYKEVTLPHQKTFFNMIRSPWTHFCWCSDWREIVAKWVGIGYCPSRCFVIHKNSASSMGYKNLITAPYSVAQGGTQQLKL